MSTTATLYFMIKRTLGHLVNHYMTGVRLKNILAFGVVEIDVFSFLLALQL